MSNMSRREQKEFQAGLEQAATEAARLRELMVAVWDAIDTPYGDRIGQAKFLALLQLLGPVNYPTLVEKFIREKRSEL
jgi:hypothetical protein